MLLGTLALFLSKLAMKKDKRLGFLVAVEGVLRSGKTTLANALRVYYPYSVATEEPTMFFSGRKVRLIKSNNYKVNKIDNYSFSLLRILDHSFHVSKVIAPYLREGAFIISDGYIEDTLAEQTVRLESSKYWLKRTIAPITETPDLIVLLLINEDQMKERRYSKRQIDFYSKVQEEYLNLVEKNKNRFVVIEEDKEKNLLEKVMFEIDKRWRNTSTFKEYFLKWE